jgi:hypothetical protein
VDDDNGCNDDAKGKSNSRKEKATEEIKRAPYNKGKYT